MGPVAAFSTKLLYGGEAPEWHSAEPAYSLDSSDLKPAREEANAWFRAARGSARGLGRAVPSAVAIMELGREVYRYPAGTTFSEPTSGRGGPGR